MPSPVHVKSRLALGLVMISVLFQPAIAQQRAPSITLPLWSEGAPGALGNDAKDKPQAMVYLPQVKADRPTAALVICPGGGYGGLAMDHEGYQIATWANSIGMAAIICDYRHRNKGYGHPAPMQDAQCAIRLTRSMSADWNIDPAKVGILGFSAGGHLASTVLTHFDSGDSTSSDPIAKQNCRPDFGVLCYAVIGFGKPYTHGGSQRNLLGADASQDLIASLSNEDQVSRNTPPTFLWHTQEDAGVPAENSIQFYAAMLRNKVPGELHVFEKGPHGAGLAKDVPNRKDIPSTSAWPTLCAEWLRVRETIK